MLRPLVCAAFAVVLFAAAALAFDVEATIKKVDADKGVVFFNAKDKDRSATVAKDAKILDAQGKPLADGLKSKELKEGTGVILTIEREGDKPVIHAIKLGKKDDKPVPAKETPRVDTSKLVALTDLGNGDYQGFKGGLYPDGKNERPADHEKAGLALAKNVQPLDKDGKPSADGKIVLLGIGFSNTVQCFNGFMRVAKDDKDVNPKVVLVNGAVGGRSANMIQNPNDNGKGAEYWATVDKRLEDAGVTRNQVQVIWLKETNPAPHEGGFPKYTQTLQAELAKIVQILPKRFPNVKLVYCSSRSYGGWAKPAPGRSAPGNSEPYSYETGFAVKGLIEQQLKGDKELNFNADKSEVKAPWLSWGPYLWANGENKRKDGFSFKPTDFRENDRMHHSPDDELKMGNQLLQFFKTDTTTKSWFVKK